MRLRLGPFMQWDMAVFFTADTHFGHSGIIKLANRPYRSVADMDAAMVDNWNEVVGPEDIVYHLGDFAFKGSKAAAKYLALLNGRIVLLQGNHDTENTGKLERWEGRHDLLEITVDKTRVVLCHYPLLEWPGAFRGAVHLHGHTHGRVPPNRLRCDVGVDVWAFRPVTLPEILAFLSEAAPYHPTDFYES